MSFIRQQRRKLQARKKDPVNITIQENGADKVVPYKEYMKQFQEVISNDDTTNNEGLVPKD